MSKEKKKMEKEIENLKSKVTSLLLDFINEVEFTDLMSKYNGK